MFDPILKTRINQRQSSQKLTIYTVWSTCTDFSSCVYYNCPKYLPVICRDRHDSYRAAART